jgi:hypothetical protein
MGVKMKYKNKDGIELNYTNDDLQSRLVKEVVSEAIKILTTYNRFDGRSAEYALHRGVNFLKDNFDLWEESSEERSDKWIINQFNRNRSVEDQVSTIEELEKRIDEISNS